MAADYNSESSVHTMENQIIQQSIQHVAQLYTIINVRVGNQINMQVFTILWSFNATKPGMTTFWKK